MYEKVLVVLKPDCLKRRLARKIISHITDAGFFIKRLRVLCLDECSLKTLYRDIVQAYFYNDLSEFMTSGPCIVMLVEGEDAVADMNKLKYKIREEYKEYWIELTDHDLKLWEENRHPKQKTLNIKLVAANLMHVCDSVEESIECAWAILKAA